MTMQKEKQLPLLLGFLLFSGGSAWAKEVCPTERYTANGECCKACNVGEGVVQPCGINQTVCEPCLDSVTYSDTVSATEPCKPCKECVGLEGMLAPCVESDDTVCKCIYGYYRDERSNLCKKCRICEVGYGLVYPCWEAQNTWCEKCPPGTYSDEANHVDPCFPCTVCEEDEITVKECTPTSDAKCKALHPRWLMTATPMDFNASDEVTNVDDGLFRTTDKEHLGTTLGLFPTRDEEYLGPGLDYPTMGPETLSAITNEPDMPEDDGSTVVSTVASTAMGSTSTVMGSSQPVIRNSTADNLIPVYCSILAAVVVGLVAYIAFKRWNSCKQNKQGANNRPVNQTPSPEGEKLHSDSGISVDSQSLHDQQPQTQTASMQGLKGDGNLYTSLPASKREEVEKLLNGSTEETWRHLAGELGYKEDHIDCFTQEEYPVRALLSDWSSKDSATMDALYSALRKIQRGDIVESLYSESTASSPV